MSLIDKIFKKLDSAQDLDKSDLTFLLSIEEKSLRDKLFQKAYEVKKAHVGQKVYLRGLVEISNICEKDCLYCGIRKSNSKSERYLLSESEIIDSVKWAIENNYASIVIQAGERKDSYFTEFIEKILKKIKKETAGRAGITLSLGEQSEETYKRWFEAGAHRYLLRIETSNPKLYAQFHPADHIYEERVNCIKLLKKLGYQLGTGVMCGLPGQTLEDLADDIMFFKKTDADMIGMGPYIPHHETPLADLCGGFDAIKEKQLELGLKMIAVTRIYLKDVNIAATTALQSLDHKGREKGLMAGANVIMPNVTSTQYRAKYTLYDNKPCLDENASMCRSCLQRRVESIGESIAYGEWGDPVHYFKNSGKGGTQNA